MASAKQNKAKIDRLNSLFGFKRKYNPKTRKTTGKEFFMGGEYGRSYLGYRSAKESKKISDNLC